MFPEKTDLIILPFKATLKGLDFPLTLEHTLSLLRKDAEVQIERSYTGAAETIGWTIFRRTPGKYLYENEPLFRFECGAYHYIRNAYAIHCSLLGDDGMTRSHIYM